MFSSLAYDWLAARTVEHSLSEAWESRAKGGMDFVVLGPTFLALGLYLNTLTAEFAYDDRLVDLFCVNSFQFARFVAFVMSENTRFLPTDYRW